MSNYLALLVAAYMALNSLKGPLPRVNETEWANFKLEHGKSYQSAGEETLRRLIYAYNKQQVDTLQGSVDFELGLNVYSDRTEEEMKQINGLRVPIDERTGLLDLSDNSPESQKFLDDILNDESSEVPDEVDWRKVPGRVTRVKFQGECGSCWAFATTGVLEGQEIVRVKNRSQAIELSEQNLLDCDYSDHGCRGGWPIRAMRYLSTVAGIDDEQSYPYKTKRGECRFREDRVVFTDKGAALLPEGDEEKLKKVVARFGPVAVGIDAFDVYFHNYKGGVYTHGDCDKQGLNHAVLVVGYGTDKEQGDYWIVKNSWGESWGEKGYVRFGRNRDNLCGIATAASIPTF